jgi:hypothetical protein
MQATRRPLQLLVAFCFAASWLPSVAQSAPLHFIPVTPCRVVDTRDADGIFGGPALQGGTSRDFPIPQSACNVPSTAAAYSLNVTVVPQGTLGYLTVWPSGQSQPLVSTLNSLDGRIKANAAIVPAGDAPHNEAISVFATDTTDVVLDINGYFVPATDPSALEFYPVTPCRLVDTRNPMGQLDGPSMAEGETRDFPLLSRSCNIPNTAQAYSLNFTVVPNSTLGYLTTWPMGQAQPLVSTLNDLTGTIVANAAIVPAGTGGDINVFVTDATDVVIDVNGYFAPANAGGQSLYTVAPCRVLDTRKTTGAFSGTLAPPVDVVNSPCGIPNAAQAYVSNATVVPPDALGYLSLWPDTETQPLVSTLNALDGAITSNMAIVPTVNRLIDAFAAGTSQLVLDISSYFAPVNGLPAPAISSLSPASTVAGTASLTAMINGNNFSTASTVTFNGILRSSTFLGPTQIEVTLIANDLSTVGNYPIMVGNSSAGSSQPVNFSVLQQGIGPLAVTVGGLPSGLAALVVVSGPNSFNQILTQTTTLTNLTPGTYATTAAVVSSSAVAYVPLVTSSPATVAANSTANINVGYASLGLAWQPVGPFMIPTSPGPGAGKLQAFAINNSNPLVMYTGGGIGPGDSGPYTEAGVYKSTDGGSHWAQADVGLSDSSIDSLWIDQNNPSTIVTGTFSAGIFQSTDGGATWKPTGQLGSSTALLQISNTLYAATLNGIAMSLDSGTSWNVIESTAAPARSLATAAGVIYAGLGDGTVLIQPSRSASWTNVSPSVSPGHTVWSIAVNPTNAQVAFVVEWGGYSTPDLYVTNDGGGKWQAVTSITCPVQVVAFDSTGSTLYAGCDGSLWQSTTAGLTWSQLASAGDTRLLVPTPDGISGHLVFGGDQGLYLSTNGGNTWQSLNGNIGSSILYGVDVSGSTILTAVQDYGPLASFDGGGTWNLVQGGEGGAVMFNPGRPQYAYSFTIAGFQYSSDGGRTFSNAQGLPQTEFSNANGDDELIAVDSITPSTVYVAAKSGIYKSVDWGISWSLQPWQLSQPTMVTVSPVDGNTIFVGTPEMNGMASLFFTRDGGASWNVSKLPATCGSPSSALISRSNPQMVLLGMSGPPPCGGILRSTDGGANFAFANRGVNQSAIRCDAPTIPHLGFDPYGSGIVAAATDSGLYISSDFGSNWINIRGNAVPSVFTQPVWSNSYLYASTCGEGVLRMPFPF